MEYLSISAFEKPITFLNSLPLRSRPTPAPTLAEKKLIKTAVTAISNATPIILNPDIIRYLVCIASTSTPASLSHLTAYAIPMDFVRLLPMASNDSSILPRISKRLSFCSLPESFMASSSVRISTYTCSVFPSSSTTVCVLISVPSIRPISSTDIASTWSSSIFICAAIRALNSSSFTIDI